MTRFTRPAAAWAIVAMFALTAVGCGGDDSRPSGKPSASGSGSRPADATVGGAADADSKPSQPAAAGDAAKPAAGGWGTISGSFHFDGTPPTLPKLDITKDVEFCGKMPAPNEELVVNPENKGIQNIVVMLTVARGEEAPTPHESYAEAAAENPRVDNLWCRFEPHVKFVQAGQSITFGNEDEVGHNVKGDPLTNSPFNQIIAAGETFDVKLDSAERMPFNVSCSIHPWMTGWVVVQDHPYVAISDADGSFELANVPSGSWTFQVWQEKAGYLKQLEVGGSETSLSRGRWEVNVFDEAEEGNAEKNALGQIMVPASNF